MTDFCKGIILSDTKLIQGEILEQAYKKVVWNDEVDTDIRYIVSRAEHNKGMLAVVLTLLVQKIYNPSQDIRYHQQQLPNGFSGRTVDTEYVTPFLKGKGFPAMSESGWLTRSFEQPIPYTMDYPAMIRPKEAKESFLRLVDKIQNGGIDLGIALNDFIALLISHRDTINVELAKPHCLSIRQITNILKQHFEYGYTCAGASRLPVLAMYSLYQCLVEQTKRYSNKILCPLAKHNSADKQSKRIGDIDIVDQNNNAFEGVEIKHMLPISLGVIRTAYEKFKVHKTSRYYILTTAETKQDINIVQEIERIGRIHGCQVIVGNIYNTISMYLQLLDDTSSFVSNYVDNMKNDNVVKFQHKNKWNDIIGSGSY